MKKILMTLCVVTFSVAAYSQGFLTWSTSASAITAQTNSTSISPLFGGGSTGGGAQGSTINTAGTLFYYELLFNTSFNGSQVAGASSPSNSFATLFGGTWLDTGLSATNASSAAGRLSPNPGNTGAQVTGWGVGVTNNCVVVGWSANLGTVWGGVSGVSNLLATTSNFAAGSFFGVSAAGFIAAAGGNPGPAVISSSGQTATSQGLPIFSLNTQLYALPVPEPTTIALAGLGGLSLLLFRRRKV
ncbi:MAG TPA: PEP-CTERM sorting domain-containing protein [Methylomirabilota bacterium]|nr:PEP-CTERM sorting domain-containing protein [Methylomirabilota bacterium]